MPVSAIAAPVRLAALGDSLTAGYGVAAPDAFPVRLQKALRDAGYDVVIENYGISGDTTSGGLSRLEPVIRSRPDGVILELGANDALRGIAPDHVRANLEAMLTRLHEAGIPVLLCGMRALSNYGRDYATAFEAIYPDLAARHGAVLFPFFLERVIGRPDLNQSDGLHPNRAGVDVIVAHILPVAETFLRRLGDTPSPAAR
jgi:acyl-CoA thioesterase-1